MKTTSKGFKKPEDTDSADLKVFVGDNMDLLETELDKKVDDTKIASNTELGLVKVGTGLSVDADGTLNATGSNLDGSTGTGTGGGIFGNYEIRFNSTTNTLDFVYIGA